MAVNQAGWGCVFLALTGPEVLGCHLQQRPKYHTVIL